MITSPTDHYNEVLSIHTHNEAYLTPAKSWYSHVSLYTYIQRDMFYTYRLLWDQPTLLS
jgi:hypothetical protein